MITYRYPMVSMIKNRQVTAWVVKVVDVIIGIQIFSAECNLFLHCVYSVVLCDFICF